MPSKQVKITIDHALAESFKSACINAGVSMAAEISAFMAVRIGDLTTMGKKSTDKTIYNTKGKRRRQVTAIITQLEDILRYEETYLQNVPENLQNSSFYENGEQSVEALEQALDILREAY